MKIFIKVKPSSKTKSVKKTGEKNFEVRVKEPSKEGKANEAVIKVLADYFDLPKSKIEIVAGKNSKQKIVEIIK